jgi:hypothetical protein
MRLRSKNCNRYAPHAGVCGSGGIGPLIFLTLALFRGSVGPGLCLDGMDKR